MTLYRPVYPRLMKRVSMEPSGCWLWRGNLTNGYGTISVHGRRVKVHRCSYEMFNGPIPDGLAIDHLCRQRACINPLHLEAVTLKENILRGESPTAERARKTHCIRGHSLCDAYRHGPKGGRRCRPCWKALDKRRIRKWVDGHRLTLGYRS